MRWQMGRRSTNVEDRRGVGLPIAAGGGPGTVVLLLLAMFFGFDPGALPQTEAPQQGAEAPASPAHDEARDFVSVVLADTEDTWRELFRRMRREYRAPKIVLFNGTVQSACGIAGSATGRRRRSAAEAGAGAGGARVVHARQLRAARALAQGRSRSRRRRGVRHLPRPGALASLC